MPRRRTTWSQLSAGQRTTILTVGAVDAGLRVWALVDLARRPRPLVRGPKWLWATGLCLVSSGGVLPGAYLLAGRERRG